jgi:hypothetical protein
MSDDRASEGSITRAELAELAVLFDRFEFAFDPLSQVAREAESSFDDLVLRLFDEHVKPNHPSLPLDIFHHKIRSLCRAYLRKGTV